jgi:hypothetical protein
MPVEKQLKTSEEIKALDRESKDLLVNFYTLRLSSEQTTRLSIAMVQSYKDS